MNLWELWHSVIAPLLAGGVVGWGIVWLLTFRLRKQSERYRKQTVWRRGHHCGWLDGFYECAIMECEWSHKRGCDCARTRYERALFKRERDLPNWGEP